MWEGLQGNGRAHLRHKDGAFRLQSIHVRVVTSSKGEKQPSSRQKKFPEPPLFRSRFYAHTE